MEDDGGTANFGHNRSEFSFVLAIEQRDSFPYYSLVVGMKGIEKHPYDLKFANLEAELQNISQNAAVEMFEMQVERYAVCLLYWYKSTNTEPFSCFTGTKVHILTYYSRFVREITLANVLANFTAMPLGQYLTYADVC
jgi:hypothetical protein